MAYIEPRKNKHGEIIAYRIRVNKGYDKNGKKLKPYELTFKPDPDKTERQNMKALNEALCRVCKEMPHALPGRDSLSLGQGAVLQKELPVRNNQSDEKRSS